LLPILFLPVVIPIILCAVNITSNLLLELPLADSIHWINLVIFFDLIYFIIGPFCFYAITSD